MEEILSLERKEYKAAIWFMDEKSSMSVNVDKELAQVMYNRFMHLHSQMQQTQMDLRANCLVMGCILRDIQDQKLYQYICKKDTYSSVGYSSFFKFCKDVYGFKERTAKRLVAVAREFCGSDGGMKIDYLNFSYSQLAELLTIEEKYRPRITVQCSVRDIRALGKYYKNNVPHGDTAQDDLQEYKKLCQEEKARLNEKKNALKFIPSKLNAEKVPTSALSETFEDDEEDEREISTPISNTLPYESVRKGLLRQLELLRTCDTGVAWKKAADIMEEALERNAPSKVARFKDVVDANIEIADLKGKLQDLETQQSTIREGLAVPPGKKLSLKNAQERRDWLDAFRTWPVWLEVPEVSKVYYRYDFINGNSLVIETGVEYWLDWQRKSNEGSKYKKRPFVRYAILSEDRPEFDCAYAGGVSGIVDWLTKHAKEI